MQIPSLNGLSPYMEDGLLKQWMGELLKWGQETSVLVGIKGHTTTKGIAHGQLGKHQLSCYYFRYLSHRLGIPATEELHLIETDATLQNLHHH